MFNPPERTRTQQHSRLTSSSLRTTSLLVTEQMYHKQMCFVSRGVTVMFSEACEQQTLKLFSLHGSIRLTDVRSHSFTSEPSFNSTSCLAADSAASEVTRDERTPSPREASERGREHGSHQDSAPMIAPVHLQTCTCYCASVSITRGELQAAAQCKTFLKEYSTKNASLSCMFTPQSYVWFSFSSRKSFSTSHSSVS